MRQRAISYFAQATTDEQTAVRHFRNGSVTIGTDLLKLANHRRRRAMNILEKKLPKLGEKMAEFLTYQLPGVDNGDQSISAF